MNLNDTDAQPCPGCGGNGWHNGAVGSRICEAGCSGAGWVRWGLWARIAQDHAASQQDEADHVRESLEDR